MKCHCLTLAFCSLLSPFLIASAQQCGPDGPYCGQNQCCTEFGTCAPILSRLCPPPPPGSCGAQWGGVPCPAGFCCSKWGFCGTTDAYCAPENCQSQCPVGLHSSGPSPDVPVPPPGSCGPGPDDQKCQDGFCCSKWGFCGNTSAYCAPENCQSQCPPVPPGSCGPAVGGAECPKGLCCSKWGFCGSTEAYCSPENCESQCPPSPSAYKSGLLLNTF